MSDDSNILEIQSIDRQAGAEGVDVVRIKTSGGVIDCRLNAVERPDSEPVEQAEPVELAAVIWVGGASGGLTGPAGGMYQRLAAELVQDRIASLRVHYRHPNELVPCVLDTLAAAHYMQSLGCPRLILVGHSFGGAVVITAGVQSDAVIGVITLASQNADTELAEDLSPRALFCLHGAADTILPSACSRDIIHRAREPKLLKIYPDCGHGFDQCAAAADSDILAWIRDLVQKNNDNR